MLWALPLLFGSTAQAMATRNPQSSRRFASSMRGSYQPGVLRTMARNGRDFALQCQRFAVTDEFGQQHGTHPWLVWVAGDQQYRDSSSMVGFRSCLLQHICSLPLSKYRHLAPIKPRVVSSLNVTVRASERNGLANGDSWTGLDTFAPQPYTWRRSRPSGILA